MNFLLIANQENRLIWRRRSTWLLWGLFCLMLLIATLLSHHRQERERRQQASYQNLVRQQWLEQPDRHPHRVAHYGSFAFKQRSPLASFDPGIDAYAGRIQFLEAHRQNGMNFAEAGSLTSAGRLGELSPAFVAGPLLALVIVVLGHGMWAEERETGRLRLLIGQGVGSVKLWWAKSLGLALALWPFFLLVAGVLIGLVAASNLGSQPKDFPLLHTDSLWIRGGLLAGSVTLHAGLWVLLVMAVSAACSTPRLAAGILICLWLCSTVVLPRVAAGLASSSHPLPSKSAFNALVSYELAKLGDSHNPNDPAFIQFREETLKRYGVSRVEDLPVNYKGLVMEKSEEQTARVFQNQLAILETQMDRQNSLLRHTAWVSPTLALQDISARLCGTDSYANRLFLHQAEEWRYHFIQRLNALQKDHISYEKNSTQRLDKDHWLDFEDFKPKPPGLRKVLRGAWQGWVTLGGLLFGMAALGSFLAGRREMLW